MAKCMKCYCGSSNTEDISDSTYGVSYVKKCVNCNRKYTQLGVDLILGKSVKPKPKKISRKMSKKKKQAVNQSTQLLLE